MDLSQYPPRYFYDGLNQPKHLPAVSLSPPFLSLDSQKSIFRDPSYGSSYGHVSDMPIPIFPILGTYTQTPTPDLHSVSPPFSPGVAALSIDSPPPQSSQNNDTVSISTVFHPGGQPPPDTVLSSSDGVLFYVHCPTLVKTFPSVFQRPGFDASLTKLACRETSVQLDAPSDELNVILHALYGMSPAAQSPSFNTLIAAVDRMPSYQISPERLIRPYTAVYKLLLSYAALRPLELYALGAFHDIHPLAVCSSAHLLAYLATITDPMAERIGAVYLKKLFFLHSERLDSLKSILLHPPRPHPTTKDCTFQDQRRLTRAWALVSAYLAWDTGTDLSTQVMKSALSPLVEDVTCDMCHQALRDRINNVLAQWSSVKRTI